MKRKTYFNLIIILTVAFLVFMTPVSASVEYGDSSNHETEFSVPEDSKVPSSELEEIVYDRQPLIKEDVQHWIDLYNETLAEKGILAAMQLKPHWKEKVEQDLMPGGYYCERVDDDADFGEAYYTFFARPVPLATRTASNITQLKSAITSSAAGDVIEITADFSLNNAAVEIPNGKTIKIQSAAGNTYTLTQNGATVNIRHFEIAGGGSLTLENIILTTSGINLQQTGGIQVKNKNHTSGATLTLNNNAIIDSCGNNLSQPGYRFGGGVHVEDHSTLVMNSGSIVRNCRSIANGGGVSVYGGGYGGANFIMNGGEIYGNVADGSSVGVNVGGGGVGVVDGNFTMKDGALIHDNEAQVGGGVVSFGATGTNDTVFTMNGGKIYNNKQTRTANGGGGVCVLSNGKFVMNGGDIYQNKAAFSGGGVSISSSGTFTMDGDSSIFNNTADYDGGGIALVSGTCTVNMKSGEVTGNQAKNGGGIVLAATASQSVFNMNGGTVSDNQATASGGGAYINKGTTSGEFTVSDGTIADNDAKNHGGGLYVNSGTFSMKAGSILANIASDGNGGGIYLTPDGVVNIGSSDLCNVKNNEADSGDGGGIYAATYAADYAGLTVGQKAYFSNNTASRRFSPPVDDDFTFWKNIDNQSSSLDVSRHEGNHLNPLNNFDINVLTHKVQYFIDNTLIPEWSMTVVSKSKILEPTYLTSTLDSWYRDSMDGMKWNFEADRVSRDTDLYAETQTSFAFLKVDGGNPNKFLKDAEFNLYKWVGTGAVPDEPVPDNLQASGWELVSSQKSDADGNVSLGKLKYGIVYQLAEVKAPSGYQLPMGQWRITVDKEGSLVFNTDISDMKPPAFENVGTEEVPLYRLRNVAQFDLPLSGGGTALLFAIGGIILISCAAGYYLRRRSLQNH